MAFNFQDWIKKFQVHKAETGGVYNDATSYGVIFDAKPNGTWRVLGIHHLTPEENAGKHHVFIEVLCKQNQREGFRAIHWTWEGRRPDETAAPVFAGSKPLNEVVDIEMNWDQKISVWTQVGEVAQGFSISHPDEAPGNTLGHHSFFVCFQEIDGDSPPVDPPVDPPTEPLLIGSLTINQDHIATLAPDQDGNVTIKIEG